MVNEAARLLAEGVTDSADTVDLATVLGLGFAPFRGGLAKFADTVGTEKIVAQLEELAAKHGPRFARRREAWPRARWLAGQRPPAPATPSTAVSRPQATSRHRNAHERRKLTIQT